MSFSQTNWINAATASVTTDPIQVLGTTQYAVQVTSTGGPSVTVTLQGSLDLVNWVTIMSAPGPGGIGSISWNKSSGEGPVGYIRLVMTMSGGSSPTVSVSALAV